MNYFIKRDLNEYGPYSLADLQKYVASGNILLTDQCRSEGLMDWVPVSQVIGNIPVPAAAQPAPAAPAAYAAPAVSPYPPPPNLHWGICLLLSIVTCGIFSVVWIMVEALWVKKVRPASKAVTYFAIVIGLYVLYLVLSISGAVSAARTGHTDSSLQGIQGIISLGILIMWIVGAFNMRDAIEEHFNSAEPIGLSLSGVMTFFFNVWYFQYHFTKINEMKRRQMGYTV
ncbi:MAG TPA: GYF domain-containing protein [Candidatus Acidoferrum sp.]|nr:GYF domain-containing protein [Candidatus Acidoferrum sp.]